jgi:SAM-dependent methyltransferase
MKGRSNFYRGQTALEYELRRSDSTIWRRENETLDDLLRALNLSLDRPVVIDVPVGTGRFLDIYGQLGWNAHGLDISEEMLVQARRRGTPTTALVCANANALPIGSETVDVAVCIRFAHLVPRSLLRGSLSELRRALKPGGWLVIGARVHEFRVPGRSMVRRFRDAISRLKRGWRFAAGKANSHSHPLRWFMRVLRSLEFEMTELREITQYDDGSRYVIAVIRAGRDRKAKSVELMGLPGVGKSTLTRALVRSEQSRVHDGFQGIQPLSLVQVLKVAPVRSTLLLVRLLPVFTELRTSACKRVVVASLRQAVASRVSGPILFEEGIAHEVWRQLMAGAKLSDRLLKRVLPVADLTVIVEAPEAQLRERLMTKTSPGPVSRALIAAPQDGEMWRMAEANFARIRHVLELRPGRSVTLVNGGDLQTGQDLLMSVLTSPSIGWGPWLSDV